MTETARDLERVLTTYADRAAPARPDLAALVEGRYRRRGHRRAITAATVVLLTVGATVLSVSSLRGDGGHPVGRPTGGVSSKASPNPSTAPSVTATPSPRDQLFVPPKVDPPRDVTQVWPQAFVDVPATGPGGASISVIDALDATHVVLVTGFPFRLYDYDTTRHIFRTVAGPLTAAPTKIGWWAVTPHWVVYGIQTGPQIDVYRVPLGGGTPAHLATLPGLPIGPWYATDEAIYWSQFDPGVWSLPMSGGTPRLLPGLDTLRIIDHSGWAVGFDGGQQVDQPELISVDGIYVTRTLRNVVTGITVTVTAPRGAVWLQCAPAYCLGGNDSTGGPIFLARTDGSGQTWLSDRLDGGRLLMVGDTGLVTDYADFVYDPTTGLIGGHGLWAGDTSGGSTTTFRGANLMAWADGGAAYGAFLLLTRI